MTDELADHIARLPPLGDDDAAYVVFADWLQSRGDPWGELIMLQHRGMDDLANTLLRARGNDFLGDIYREPKHELVWHLGFLRRATLRTSTEKPAVLAALRALAKAPCAARLDELVLDPRPETFATTRDWTQSRHNIEDPWPDWDDLGPLLLRELGARKLAFGAWPAAPECAYVQMPSLDMIARWFHKAGLHTLRLTGSWPTDRSEVLNLDDLHELALHFAHGSDAALLAVAGSKLSSLERLTISLGGSAHCVLDTIYSPDDGGYPDTFTPDDLASLDVNGVADARISADVLRRFLDALPPELADLSFTSSILTADVLRLLVAHPRVAKLRRLDLSGCAISDNTITALVDAAGALASIGSIDLSRNAFSEPSRIRITRALPNAVVGESQGDPDFFMRYVATME